MTRGHRALHHLPNFSRRVSVKQTARTEWRYDGAGVPRSEGCEEGSVTTAARVGFKRETLHAKDISDYKSICTHVTSKVV